MSMYIVQFLINNALALFLGAIIGLERQWRQRNAGLRTNALVSLGAGLFVSLSILVTGVTDQTRMAAQVVSGIGFLGAGIMMREGLNIRGLNTAATLWSAGAIGTLAGSGFTLYALSGTVLVVSTHFLLRPLGNSLNRWLARQEPDDILYILRIVCRSGSEQHVRTLLLQQVLQESLLLQSIESTNIPDTNKVEVLACIFTNERQDNLMEKAVGMLSLDESVTAAGWKNVPRQYDE